MTTSDYTFTFDDAATTKSAGALGDAANADIQSILSASGPVAPAPVIQSPPDTYVRLPGGLVVGDSVVTNAEVQELTGEHEEALAKAHGNAVRFVRTLLNCGVVNIGDDRASQSTLKDLSIGDREALILGIRRATFGSDVTLNHWMCPNCGELLDVTVSLDDIPVKRLDEPDRTEYEVPLRKGGKATVRVPNGHDQEFVLENDGLTLSEQNTLLLSRAVIRLEDADGNVTLVQGRPGKVKPLGIADRNTLLKWCNQIQPGPQYDEVKFKHEECGKEVSVPLSVAELFRDL